MYLPPSPPTSERLYITNPKYIIKLKTETPNICTSLTKHRKLIASIYIHIYWGSLKSPKEHIWPHKSNAQEVKVQPKPKLICWYENIIALYNFIVNSRGKQNLFFGRGEAHPAGPYADKALSLLWTFKIRTPLWSGLLTVKGHHNNLLENWTLYTKYKTLPVYPFTCPY